MFRKHTSGFTIVSNKLFMDKNLSLQAKGLMCLMLSLPENWNFSVKGLATASTNGVDATNSAIKELERNGYLRRSGMTRNENGQFENTIYDLYEEPHFLEDNLDIDIDYIDPNEGAETKVSKSKNTAMGKSQNGENNKINNNIIYNNKGEREINKGKGIKKEEEISLSNPTPFEENEYTKCCSIESAGKDIEKRKEIVKTNIASYEKRRENARQGMILYKGDIANYSNAEYYYNKFTKLLEEYYSMLENLNNIEKFDATKIDFETLRENKPMILTNIDGVSSATKEIIEEILLKRGKERARTYILLS